MFYTFYLVFCVNYTIYSCTRMTFVNVTNIFAEHKHFLKMNLSDKSIGYYACPFQVYHIHL